MGTAAWTLVLIGTAIAVFGTVFTLSLADEYGWGPALIPVFAGSLGLGAVSALLGVRLNAREPNPAQDPDEPAP